MDSHHSFKVRICHRSRTPRTAARITHGLLKGINGHGKPTQEPHHNALVPGKAQVLTFDYHFNRHHYVPPALRTLT